VFAIDCATNRLVSLTQVEQPKYIAVDSLDNKVYCPFGPAGAESVLVLRSRTDQRIASIPMNGAKYSLWDRVTDRMYVSCDMQWNVGVIDCRTDSVIAAVRVGDGPMKMALDSRRRKLYVQLYDEGAVAVIDLRTNTLARTIRTGLYVLSAVFSTAADKYYVGMDREVVVIDPASDSIVRRIPVAGDVVSLATNDEGMLLYAGGNTPIGADSVWTIDMRTDSVVAARWTGGEPWDIYHSPVSGQAYCLSDRPAQVAVLSGDGREVRGTLGLSDAPYVIAASTKERRLYVGHLNSRKVYVVRDSGPDDPQFGGPEPDTGRVLAWPNPFGTSVSCRFELAGQAAGPVAVFDRSGRLVQTVDAIKTGPSRAVADWDGRDASGSEVADGVYFLVPQFDGAAPARVVRCRQGSGARVQGNGS
jgi:DNA-binding beta-propeller fold protein YncE